MIKNERQYKITKSQIRAFEKTLAEIENRPEHDEISSINRNAILSQIEDLLQQVSEYELLRSGSITEISISSLEEIPLALIQARIMRGLSQKELSEMLGLKEQQIQLYEATEYTSASNSRLVDIANALGIKLAKETRLAVEKMSLDRIFNRLSEVGIERRFILEKILPLNISEALNKLSTKESRGVVLKALGRISRVFKWTPNEILGTSPLEINTNIVSSVRYKIPANVDENKVSAYTLYAHYLALLIVQLASHLPIKPMPSDPYEIRDSILKTYGIIGLNSTLQYLWEHGIPVFALDDSGSFHGACFREKGRNIIVAKQKTPSASRWIFDIFHELWHALQEPDQLNRTDIEIDWSLYVNQKMKNQKEEIIANQFAGAILIGPRAKELVEICFREADNDIPRLKQVVQNVAKREKAPVDALANYIAFILSLDGWNWWGVATKLQNNIDPTLIVKDIMLKYLKLEALSEPDMDLLSRAINPRGGK